MSWFSDLIDGSQKAAAAQAQQQQAAIEAQQAQHDTAVQQGATDITNAFSQFTPDYYAGITNAYNDANQPALTDQYNIARDQLTAQLAGTDQSQSSVGNNAEAQLQKTYNTNQTQIANQGVDAANALKSTVNNDENQLFSENLASADPLTTAAQAQATAGTIVAPSAQPSLGNVFAGALGSVASGAKTGAQSYAGLPTQTAPSAAPLPS